MSTGNPYLSNYFINYWPDNYWQSAIAQGDIWLALISDIATAGLIIANVIVSGTLISEVATARSMVTVINTMSNLSSVYNPLNQAVVAVVGSKQSQNAGNVEKKEVYTSNSPADIGLTDNITDVHNAGE